MREYRAATMIAVLGFSFLHFVFDTRVMKIISLFAIALKQHRFHCWVSAMAVVFPIGKAITEGVIFCIIFIIHFPFFSGDSNRNAVVNDSIL